MPPRPTLLSAPTGVSNEIKLVYVGSLGLSKWNDASVYSDFFKEIKKRDFGPDLFSKAENPALQRGHKEGRCNSLTQGQIPSKRSSLVNENAG